MTSTLVADASPRTVPRVGRTLPWTRRSIGIAVGVGRTVAVERSGTKVRWVLEGPGVGVGEDPVAVFEELLDRLPRSTRSWGTPQVVLILPPHLAQCKPLFGLPVVADPRTASAIVAEGASRFFRGASDELLTSPAELHADGSASAAAFPLPIVRALLKAAQNRAISLRAVAPAEALDRDDAPLSDDIDVATAWRAAASAARRAPIRYNALATTGVAATVSSPSRMRRATIVASVLATLAMLLPGATALLMARAAARAHDAILEDEVAALRVAADLQVVSRRLLDIAERRNETTSVVQLIAALNVAMPRGAAVTHLAVDSAGGTVIALAPSADAVREGLASTPLILAPEVIGPVTRERVGDRELERVNLRFRSKGTLIAGATP